MGYLKVDSHAKKTIFIGPEGQDRHRGAAGDQDRRAVGRGTLDPSQSDNQMEADSFRRDARVL